MIQQKVCGFFFKCPVTHPKPVVADGCLYLSLDLSEASFLLTVTKYLLREGRMIVGVSSVSAF